MDSPATSKAIVSSEIGNGSRTSPRPSGGTCSCSGSIAAPAPTRPMIGTELSSRYSMMGVISEALIRRSPDRMSDTAPGRTPIAVARPPLVLPGFSSPRSIIVTSSMATSFPNYGNYSNSDFQKYSLTFYSEYQKLRGTVRRPRSERRETSGEGGPMQTNWANEHLDALREYLARGMSYSEIAKAINAKFKTAYSRSAAIGSARRTGIAGPGRAKDLPKHWPAPPQGPLPQPPKTRERHVPEFIR